MCELSDLDGSLVVEASTIDVSHAHLALMSCLVDVVVDSMMIAMYMVSVALLCSV
jgi:hypothetical protein